MPEYLKSTPRLISVLLSIGLILFTYLGIVKSADYVSIVTLVLGYFFGSRGQERKLESDEKKTILTESLDTNNFG